MSIERTRISFRVYGTEFCRMVSAVGLFQALPKDFASYAAIRCLARGDGLTMAATNGSSAAIGHVSTENVDGVGPFSLPHAQVKAILAVFNRKVPTGKHSWDYVLQVTVTEHSITIEDVSVLFDGDTFTIAIPHEEAAERGDLSESEQVMNTLSVLAGGLDAEQQEVDLAEGIHFSPTEVSRIARAAKALGIELHLQPNGRRLLAPLGEDFSAFTAGTLHQWDGAKPPYIDARALRAWRARLHDVVDSGVI